jgi:purine nucleosidase
MSNSNALLSKALVAPRARVIIDNDFGGDPDGLFQLAHHLLSPSIEIRAIIGSLFPPGTNFGAPASAAYACETAGELLATMSLEDPPPVIPGADSGLPDLRTPVRSKGAEAIVEEAMRTDARLPLYVACGAGLTDVASAWLMEPGIAERLTLVWIGGPESPGGAPSPAKALEYNLGIDVRAAQIVFNHSKIPIWQVSGSAYRQALVSHAELLCKVKPCGKTGRFLVAKIEDFIVRAKKAGLELGEAYVLGDSPLVLLTALQCAFDPDASSSEFILTRAPTITDAGSAVENPSGRMIRRYTRLDTRLMFTDLFSKLDLSAAG